MREPQVEVPTGGIGESEAHWGLGWSVYDWSRANRGRPRRRDDRPGGLPAGRPRRGRGGRAAHERRRSVRALSRPLSASSWPMSPAVELPAEPAPAESPPAVDATALCRSLRRGQAPRSRSLSRDGSLVAVADRHRARLGDDAGAGRDCALVPLDPEREVFLTQHPALKGSLASGALHDARRRPPLSPHRRQSDAASRLAPLRASHLGVQARDEGLDAERPGLLGVVHVLQCEHVRESIGGSMSIAVSAAAAAGGEGAFDADCECNMRRRLDRAVGIGRGEARAARTSASATSTDDSARSPCTGRRSSAANAPG